MLLAVLFWCSKTMNAAEMKQVAAPGATRLVVALDVHGGDFGSSVTIPAALDILNANSNLEILLCGIPQEVTAVLDKHRQDRGFNHCMDRLKIIDATHTLAADARPVAALRRGKGSSLWLALELSLIHISEPTRRTPISY